MRSFAVLSSAAVLAAIFAAPAFASETLVKSGVTYVKSSTRICPDGSITWANGSYWCKAPSSTTSATNTAVYNGTTYVKSSTRICSDGSIKWADGSYWCKATSTTASTGSTSTATSSTTSTVTAVYNGTTYVKSSTRICADGSIKWADGSYWCKTTSTTTPTGSTSTGTSPITSTVTAVYNGTTYAKSSTRICADGSIKWADGSYWCKVSTAPVVSAPTTPTTSTTYTAKLSWVAPSTREDGTPLSLSELKGYEIHYTSDDLTQGVTLPVSTASTTSYAVANLKPGTYHFAITAIDSKGLKSKLSTMVSTKLGS